MVVKIRLKRVGAKKKPLYRIVVADSKSPRDGKVIENLGTYNPTTDPLTVTLDQDKTAWWISKGAQPTDTVKSLLGKAGVVQNQRKN